MENGEVSYERCIARWMVDDKNTVLHKMIESIRMRKGTGHTKMGVKETAERMPFAVWYGMPSVIGAG